VEEDGEGRGGGAKGVGGGVNENELRLGFSNTTRNPEGILSHNNRVGGNTTIQTLPGIQKVC
jgi:hypothetical protein